MQPNIQKLASELVNLSHSQRMEIVRFLLFLDDATRQRDDQAEQKWEKEILRRIEAVDNGTAKHHDFDEAMRQFEKRHAL